MVNRERLAEQLVLHEGVELAAYKDTLDNWTIGVGYNIAGRGLDALEAVIGRSLDGPIEAIRITYDESLAMLKVDIDRVERAVRVHLDFYDELCEVRQRVVMDMAFNLGFRSLRFKQTIDAMRRKDWSRASREMFRSTWAYQVDDGKGGKFGRADRLGQMMLTGQDYVR